MTDEDWLNLYKEEFADIPDEILDEADEHFGFTDLDNDKIEMIITDDWYIWVMKRYHGQF